MEEEQRQRYIISEEFDDAIVKNFSKKIRRIAENSRDRNQTDEELKKAAECLCKEIVFKMLLKEFMVEEYLKETGRLFEGDKSPHCPL